jgi:hypothetical protein
MSGITYTPSLPFLVTEDSRYVDNPFLEDACYPPIVIIEPADLDTSFPVAPGARDWESDVAQRMALQIGLQRVTRGTPPWTTWASDCCLVCWWTTRLVKHPAMQDAVYQR